MLSLYYLGNGLFQRLINLMQWLVKVSAFSEGIPLLLHLAFNRFVMITGPIAIHIGDSSFGSFIIYTYKFVIVL